MKDRLPQLVYWAGTLVVLYIVEKVLDQPKTWVFQIFPTSIFRLTIDHWLGLALTFAAALVAWALGSTLAYYTGVFVGVGVIGHQRNPSVLQTVQHLNKVIDALYVVPFVLTVALCYAAAMVFYTKYGMPAPLVVAALVLLSGVALGGYHVFKSVYNSVISAKQENSYLVNSLYDSSQGTDTVWRRWLQDMSIVRRLRDCEIHSFCASLPTAFHLSVVSVIIVETVTPSFYELLFPQAGIAQAWAGGVGRQILKAQNDYAFQVVAGCIWVVLILDAIITTLIQGYLKHRWLKHY